MYLISTIKTPKTIVHALLIACSLVVGHSLAAEPKRICAIYPHLKDSYWLSVNFGMVDEARKHNVDLRVLESGGYLHRDKQRQQLSLCVKWGADAIVLGTVAPDLFYTSLNTAAASTPVFATVNKLIVDQNNRSILKGEVGVDWYWMGYYAGEYLKNKHINERREITVAMLPGPKSSGGTKPVVQGFYAAIQGSDIRVVESYWADNDKELQRNLVQQVIDRQDVDYIVGSAVAIEAAISELRSANKTDQIGLVSTYLSHGVYRGLLRNRVEFAPTDKMVLQGRLSIKQTIDYLQGKAFNKLEAPKIESLTPNNLSSEVIEESLSPSEYRPIFYIYNENN
ncbi:TMAO reductase [Vibrio tubiashii]|nr:TMAO reductase [Vibrio tubiashii]